MRPASIHPLKLAICEDIQEDADHLASLIEKCGYPARIERFSCGEEFINTFTKGQYDLVFLDIFMGGMSGVDVAEAIRGKDELVVIVFTTTSDDFTRESYRLGALKYCVKPVSAKDAAEALELARLNRGRTTGDVCSVVAGNVAAEIPLTILYYAEVFNYRCLIHTENGNVETSMSIDNLEKLLPAPRFLRCHRAYIVNLDFVRDINPRGDFIMANGDVVYVRVRDGRKMKAAYEDYLFKQTREKEL